MCIQVYEHFCNKTELDGKGLIVCVYSKLDGNGLIVCMWKLDGKYNIKRKTCGMTHKVFN